MSVGDNATNKSVSKIIYFEYHLINKIEKILDICNELCITQVIKYLQLYFNVLKVIFSIA